MWLSANTNHAMKENHLIDWDSANIVARESYDQDRGIKDAVHMKIVPQININEGRYHLSHLCNDLLGATACR